MSGFAVWNNPLFRHELRGEQARACMAWLAATNACYVALFSLARWLPHPGVRALSGSAMAAQFNHGPWLLGAAGLLSLSAHWLVPPFVNRLLGRNHDLPALNALLATPLTEEQTLRIQLAGGLAPLLLGAAPFLIGATVLAFDGSAALMPGAAGLAAFVLWGSLCASVSLWAGTPWRPRVWATVRAYALTSIVLPLGIGLVSLALASGCSAGHPHRMAVFTVAAGLTWSILVIGSAAVFWDVTIGRLFPDRRWSLWQGPDLSSRLEP